MDYDRNEGQLKMKVVIFDDHKLFGNALKRVLIQCEDIEEVQFTGEEQELEDFLKERETVIILLDINLRKAGVSDSFAFGENLIVKYPNHRVAFLSGYDLPMYRKKAAEIGARGFFSKEIDVEELAAGLRIIESGGTVFKREDRTESEKLTAMEVRVLELSAKGLKRGEIAESLHISSRTVGSHLTNVFQKLQVKTITEAISVALEKGYMPPVW